MQHRLIDRRTVAGNGTCTDCERPLATRGAARCRSCAQRHRQGRERVETVPPAPGVRRADRLAELLHRKPRLFRLVDGEIVKVCQGCRDETFEVEYNMHGQMTSRLLGDTCRRLRESRAGMNLPEPPDLRKCADCGAWEGVAYGTCSGLDDAGRCPSCATWARKVARRERREARGWRFAGGIAFPPPPSRVPLWYYLAPEPDPEPPPPPIAADALTTREAGDLLGISPNLICAWIVRGKVAARKDRLSMWRIDRAEVDRLLAERDGADAARRAEWAEGERLAGEVLVRHGVTWREARARDMRAAFVAARAEVAGRLVERGWTLQGIAALMGDRHHTTVLNWLEVWAAVNGHGPAGALTPAGRALRQELAL